MFIFTAKLTRRRAVLYVVLAGVCAALAVLCAGVLGGRPQEAPGGASAVGITDDAGRVAYLESYGWEVVPDPVETLRLLLPQEPDETWKAYNDLQREQGFDLRDCCGQRVERFTYTVLNYPDRPEGVQANLYLCGDRVVAGDLFCAGEDGFQRTLVFPAETAS